MIDFGVNKCRLTLALVALKDMDTKQHHLRAFCRPQFLRIFLRQRIWPRSTSVWWRPAVSSRRNRTKGRSTVWWLFDDGGEHGRVLLFCPVWSGVMLIVSLFCRSHASPALYSDHEEEVERLQAQDLHRRPAWAHRTGPRGVCQNTLRWWTLTLT